MSIIDIFTSIGSIILHSLETLLSYLSAIPQFIANVFNSIYILPAVFIPYIYASVAVYVVYLIIDRGGN